MTEMIGLRNRNCLVKVAFILFVFSIPLSIRKVLIAFYPTEARIFNEYMDISLYLSDVLFVLFLVALILQNKLVILSIFSKKAMFHVEHVPKVVLLPLPFVVWCGVSTFWAENAFLAVYAFIKIALGYLLYVSIIFLFVPRGTFLGTSFKNLSTPPTSILKNISWSSFFKNVPRGTLVSYIQILKSKCSTWNIWQVTFSVLIFSGFIQALLAIFQFFHQSSLGLFLLKESFFSPSVLGVAKIIISDSVLVRSYGLFPHPNILAFFLGVTLLVTMSYPVVFSKMFHVEHSKWVYRLVFGVQFFGFLVTFSKSAMAGLLLSVVYLFYKMFHVEQNVIDKKNVPRGTYESLNTKNIRVTLGIRLSSFFKMFHVEHFIVFGLVVLLALFLSFQVNWYYFIIQPLQERLYGWEFLGQLFHFSLIQGIGIGQFVVNFTDFLAGKSELWQLQPIHNLFLLIFAETGLVGIVLLLHFFSRLLYLMHMNVPRGTFYGTRHLTVLMTALIIFLLIVAQFDHYLWDIEQGQWLFWLVLGLSAASFKTDTIDK